MVLVRLRLLAHMVLHVHTDRKKKPPFPWSAMGKFVVAGMGKVVLKRPSVATHVENESDPGVYVGSSENRSRPEYARLSTRLAHGTTGFCPLQHAACTETKGSAYTRFKSREHSMKTPPTTSIIRPLCRESKYMLNTAQSVDLALAERDAKAYKSRLRSQETQLQRLEDLVEREASLERQLISAQGSSATHARECEELRKRVTISEAERDALREELDFAANRNGGPGQSELLSQARLTAPCTRRVSAATLASPGHAQPWH